MNPEVMAEWAGPQAPSFIVSDPRYSKMNKWICTKVKLHNLETAKSRSPNHLLVAGSYGRKERITSIVTLRAANMQKVVPWLIVPPKLLAGFKVVKHNLRRSSSTRWHRRLLAVLVRVSELESGTIVFASWRRQWAHTLWFIIVHDISFYADHRWSIAAGGA